VLASVRSAIAWLGVGVILLMVIAQFVAVVGASGLLFTTVVASGPFTSPFFKAVTATHVSFVATAAVTQVFAHVSKLIAFAADGWNFRDHLGVIAVGIVGVIIGSRIGTQLMGRFSEERLGQLFKIVLTALAVRLLLTALT